MFTWVAWGKAFGGEHYAGEVTANTKAEAQEKAKQLFKLYRSFVMTKKAA